MHVMDSGIGDLASDNAIWRSADFLYLNDWAPEDAGPPIYQTVDR